MPADLPIPLAIPGMRKNHRRAVALRAWRKSARAITGEIQRIFASSSSSLALMLALFSTVRPGCRVVTTRFTTRYPIVPDRWALPLCNRHHREQHDAGSERDAVHVDETINESMAITGLTQFLRDLVVGMLGQLPNGVAADAWVETVTSRRVIP